MVYSQICFMYLQMQTAFLWRIICLLPAKRAKRLLMGVVSSDLPALCFKDSEI